MMPSTSGAPPDQPVESSLVSVDVLPLRFAARDETVLVGVSRREWAPHKGKWALPGVLLGRGERLREAGMRALTGKLHVDTAIVRGMGQLTTFDEPLRDPRGPTLSVLLWAVLDLPVDQTQHPADHASSSVAPSRWSDFDSVPVVAFDHDAMITAGRDLLASKLWHDRDFTRALLGEAFTTRRALDAVQALTGSQTDRGNLNRLLRNSPDLMVGESESSGGRGRPAAVWIWR